MPTRYFSPLRLCSSRDLFGAGLAILLLLANYLPGAAQGVTTIPITTANTALVLQTDANNRLNTVYSGAPLTRPADYADVAAQSNVCKRLP